MSPGKIYTLRVGQLFAAAARSKDGRWFDQGRQVGWLSFRRAPFTDPDMRGVTVIVGALALWIGRTK